MFRIFSPRLRNSPWRKQPCVSAGGFFNAEETEDERRGGINKNPRVPEPQISLDFGKILLPAKPHRGKTTPPALLSSLVFRHSSLFFPLRLSASPSSVLSAAGPCTFWKVIQTVKFIKPCRDTETFPCRQSRFHAFQCFLMPEYRVFGFSASWFRLFFGFRPARRSGPTELTTNH